MSLEIRPQAECTPYAFCGHINRRKNQTVMFAFLASLWFAFIPLFILLTSALSSLTFLSSIFGYNISLRALTLPYVWNISISSLLRKQWKDNYFRYVFFLTTSYILHLKCLARSELQNCFTKQDHENYKRMNTIYSPFYLTIFNRRLLFIFLAHPSFRALFLSFHHRR